MPLFMDRHDFGGVSPVTAEDAAKAHLLDLEIQDKYQVRYLAYWFDYERQAAFCLIDAPNAEAAEAVHRDSHGLVASHLIEVTPEQVAQFLGRMPEAALGEAYVATAFRTIMFTDIEGSTALTQRLGDTAAMRLLRRHDEIVRGALTFSGGSEVKHTGDGIMASFSSVGQAVECAITIQRKLAEHNEKHPEDAISIRIGLAAGEPVTRDGDFFGAVVQLAARLCNQAQPGGILVSPAVRDLCMGKGFVFSKQGDVTLRGFDEPVSAYLVQWAQRR